MKKKEAYDILELPETASQEEAKKQFRKLAAKHHPDVNKDADAEAKFKKINEAYQAIDKNEFDDNFKSFGGGNYSSGFGGFNVDFSSIPFVDFDLFNWNTKNNVSHYAMEDITLDQTITFKESILGCKKEIKYDCYVMCNKCQGRGDFIVHNGCKDCNGQGKTTSKNKNVFFQQICKTCRGKVKMESCQDCSQEGRIKSERTISVSIKPGITNGTILRLTGMGNFSSYMIGNSNVLIKVKVIPETNLELNGNDVITKTKISLLQALKGCTVEVNTIDGKKEVSIPALFKNKDEVIMPNLGVDRKGNERVIVNIEYPSDVDKLIKALE